MLRVPCVLVLGLLSFSALADTTLYACHTPDGQVLLTNVRDKQCQDPIEYRYPDSPKAAVRETVERPAQNDAAQSYSFVPIPERRAAPERQSAFYEDPGACAYYKWVLNDALSIVDVRKQNGMVINPTESAELKNQVYYSQEQMDIYCRH